MNRHLLPLRYLLLVALLLGPSAAWASHFRFANLSWKRAAGTNALAVEVTVTEAWQFNSSGVGELSYSFGDGSFFNTSAATRVATLSDIAGEQYEVWRYTTTHTYPSNGIFTVTGSSCCRISTLVNAANGNELLTMAVDLRDAANTGSPVSTAPVILQLLAGTNNSVALPIVDPDGDAFTVRLATGAESSINTLPTVGTNVVSITAGGVLNWNTVGGTSGQKFALQVIIEERRTGNTSGANGFVPLDFIIELAGSLTNQPPTVTGTNGSITLAPNQAFITTFIGTDPEGSPLSVSHQGLPPGATLTPAAGTTNASPASVTFAWTPTPADVGSSYAVLLFFTDQGGLQRAASFALTVSAAATVREFELVSINGTGAASGNGASLNPVVSSNGQFVAFTSSADNLVASDLNGVNDVFWRDRLSGVTRLVSRTPAGIPGNGDSDSPAISADGRFVAFHSRASNLVATDANTNYDVFIWDSADNSVTLVSRTATGASGAGDSYSPRLSANGRVVSFASDASDLVTSDTNGTTDAFVRNLDTGVTFLVSISTSGASGNGASSVPVLSADGRSVAFVSRASDLVANDGNGQNDVFHHDLQTRQTRLVSVNAAGTGSGNRLSSDPSISADGRHVAFASQATNLVAITDTNNFPDVFVRDMQLGVTRLVSVNGSGTATGGDTGVATILPASFNPFISADGSRVLFTSIAQDLVPNDSNSKRDVFVRDLLNNTTTLISTNRFGTGSGNGASGIGSVGISADLRYVAFFSEATDIGAADTNNKTDVFLRDTVTNSTKIISRVTSGGFSASGHSYQPTISADGSTVVFISEAGNLDSRDGNGATDVFAAATTLGVPNFGVVDVGVSLSQPAALTIGTPFTITVTVTNHSAAPATGLLLANSGPSLLQFVSATPSQGTITPDQWVLGDLPANGSATATVTLVATNLGDGNVVVAISRRDQPDSNLNNNSVNVTVTANRSAAGALFHLPGNTAYVSRTNSPFFSDILAGTVTLETFERGAFNPAGITASAGVTRLASASTDSVDADDGTVDGSGVGGQSFFVAATNSLTFTFDAAQLGRLPTKVGIVLTDGDHAGSGIEAFGTNGVFLGRIGPFEIGDLLSTGQTAEDRFLGVEFAGGISALRVFDASAGFEVDHLQYDVATTDLAMSASAPTTATFGNPFQVTLTVTNRGPLTATSVVVTNADPGQVGFVSGTVTQGAFDTNATWNVGTLAPGGSASFTLTLSPEAAGALLFRAGVASALPDAHTGNDIATAAVFVPNSAPNIRFISADVRFVGGTLTVAEDAGALSFPTFAQVSALESNQLITNVTISVDNPALFAVAPSLAAGGLLTFTPAANANGSAIVTVSATDDGGTLNGGVATGTNSFTLIVSPVNDAPTLTLTTNLVVVPFGSPTAQTITGFASATPGPANEAGQSLLPYSVAVTDASLFLVQPTLSAAGDLTFTSASSVSGSTTVTLVVQDNGGTANGGVDRTTNAFTLTISAPLTLAYTWLGGTGDWHDSTKWSPAGVPGASDTVSISAGTLQVTNAVVVGGFTISGGTVTGAGALTVTTNLVISAGRFAGTGALNLPAGSTATLNSFGNKTLSRTVNNSGTVTWTEGAVIGNEDAVFNNLAGGVFEVQTDSTFFSVTDGTTGQTFNNAGTVRKTVGVGTTTWQGAFNNSGTADVQAGTVTFSGGGLSSGAFQSAASAVLAWTGGDQVLTNGASLSGAGTRRIASSGTLTVATGATVAAGGITEMTGGTLAGAGTFAVSSGGAFNMASGTLSGSGKLTIAAGATMGLSTTTSKTVSRTVDNSGTVTWTGGTVIGNANAVFNNLAGGVFDIQTDGNFFFVTDGTTGRTFNNAGTVRKTVGVGTTTWQGAFNNSGTADVQVGTVTFSGGGSSSGAFQSAAGAVVEWSGGDQVLTSGAALSGAGTRRIAGGTLTVAAGATVTAAGITELTSGILTGAGTFAVSSGGAFNMASGTLSGSGKLTIAAGATMGLSTTTSKTVSRTVDNSGTATWTGGTVIGNANAVFNNLASGIFDIQADASFFNTTDGTTGRTFNNAGTVRKTVGVGTTTWQGAFNNSGALDVQTGTVQFSVGSGLWTGAASSAASATVRWSSGAYQLGSGVTLAGEGSWELTGGTLDALAGATVTLPGSFALSTGTLGGAGNFTVPSGAGFTWISGQLGTGGVFTVASGGLLTLTGGSAKTLVRQFNNVGTVTWTGGTVIGNADVVFNNLAGGVFDIQTADVFFASTDGTTGRTFNNAGTVRKSTAGGTALWRGIFNNSGVANVQVGTVSFTDGGASSGSFITTSAATTEWAGGTQTLGAGASLTGAGGYRIAGGTLAVAAGATVPLSSPMELANGGTLAGDGIFAVQSGAVLTMSGGSATGTGALTILSGGTFNLSTTLTKTLARTVNNSGTVNWSDGTVRGNANAVFNNLVGGQFFATAAATFFATSDGTTGRTFNNAGSVFRAGFGTTSTWEGLFNNTGTNSVTSGTLTFTGGGLSSGHFQSHSGAVLEWTAGTQVLTNGAVVSGAGTQRVDSTATLTIASGTTLLADGNFTVANGTVNGDGFLDVPSGKTLTFTGGTIGGSGLLTIASGGAMTLGSGSSKFLNRNVSNSGTVTWTGAAVIGNGNPSFTNHASGVFDIQVNSTFYSTTDGTTGRTFYNLGTVRKTAGGGTTSFQGTFNHTGTIELHTGQLNVPGAFNPGAAGVLTVYLGGTTPITGYAKLVPLGTTTFGGTLNVVLTNGFTPTSGDSFVVVDGSSGSGAFAAVTGQSLAGGLFLMTNYSGGDLTLQAQVLNTAPSISFATGFLTVQEDSGAVSQTGFATFTTGGVLESTQSITNVTTTALAPSLFSVQPTIHTDGTLNFTPAADASGSTTVTVVAQDNGGTGGGGVNAVTNSFVLTISAVNDAPVITFSTNNVQVVRDLGPQTVSGFMTTSPGNAFESGQTVTLISATAANPTLFSAQPAITAGTLTFTTATRLTGSSVVTVIAQDNGGTANGGVSRATNTFTITVLDAAPTNYVWSGAVGDWNDPTKWTPTGVPGNADTARIIGGSVTITNTTTVSVLSLEADGLLTGPGNLVFPSGSTFNLTNGIVSGTGLLTVDAGATMNIRPAGITVAGLSRPLNNSGTINWSSGHIRNLTGAPLTNQVGGLFIANGNTLFVTGSSNSSVLYNFGTLQKTNAGTTIAEEFFKNHGTVDVQDGILSLRGTSYSSGVWTNAGQIQFFSGSHTFTSSSVMSGAGSKIWSAPMTVEAGSTLTLAGSATMLTTVTVEGQLVISSGNVLGISSGALTGSGSVLVQTGSQVDIGGASTKTIACTVTNAGTVNWSGGVVNGNNNAAFYNVAGGVFNVRTDSAFFSSSDGTTGRTFHNAGTVRKLASTGTTTWQGTFDNTGTLEIQTGIVSITNNYAPAAGSSLTVFLGGTTAGTQFGQLSVLGTNLNTGTLNVVLTNSFVPAVGNSFKAVEGSGGGSGAFTSTSGRVLGGGLFLATNYSSGSLFLVTSVSNTPPVVTFVANTVTVLEDAGAYSQPGFASASVGGAAESGQSLTSYTVTAADNSLFSAGPAIALNGTLTFTPAANANGTTVVTVVAQDNGGTVEGGVDKSTNTFSIAITAVNDAPTVVLPIANFAVNEDAASVVTNLTTIFSDVETAAASLTYAVVGNTNSGLVTAAISLGTNLTLTFASSGNGQSQIAVSATDGGGLAVTNTFVVTVNAVNDAPVLTLSIASLGVSEDSGLTSFPGLIQSFSPGPANESSQVRIGTYVVTNTHPSLFTEQPAVAADGTLTFTGAPDATGLITVTVRAQDDGGTANGGVDTGVATFLLELQEKNDAPSVSFSTNLVAALEDAGVVSVSNFLSTVSVGSSFEVSSQRITNFTLTPADTTLFAVGPSIDTNFTLTFTPATNANGMTTVTVVAQDNGGTSNGGVDKFTNTFTIQILPVNDAPSFAFAANSVRDGRLQISQSGADEYGAARRIVVDGTGSYFVAGDVSNGSLETTELVLIKYTGGGLPLWTNKVNIGDQGSVADMAADGLGGVVLTATALTTPNEDVVTMRFNATGGILWSNRYDGGLADEPNAIAVDTNGFVIVAGYRTSITTQKDFLAIKYTLSLGTPLWTNAASSAASGNDVANAVVVDGTGDVYVAGDGANGLGTYGYVLKLNGASGAAVWTNRLGDPFLNQNGGFAAVGLAADGNVVVGGYSQAAFRSYAVVRYSAVGGVVWSNVFDIGTQDQQVRAMAVSGNDVYVAGEAFNGSDNDFAIVKILPNGTHAWTNRYNGAVVGDADVPVALTVNNEGDVFVTGHSTRSANKDIVTLKFTSAGAPVWTNRFDGFQMMNDEPFGLATGESGEVYVAGSVAGMSAVSSSTFWTLRYGRLPAGGADQVINTPFGTPFTLAGFIGSSSIGPANESVQALSFVVTNSNPGLFSTQPNISVAGTLAFTAAGTNAGVAVVTVRALDDGGTANGGTNQSVPQTFNITVSTGVVATTYTWVGGAGGGDWNTVTNWSPNGVPGPNDGASVNGAGTITLNSDVVVRRLAFTNSTMSGAGGLTVTETFVWDSGTIGGTGDFELAAGSAITWAGASAKVLGRSLDNRGQITWLGGAVQTVGAPVFNNHSQAEFNIKSDTDFMSVLSGSAGTFNNRGLISRQGGEGASTRVFSTLNLLEGIVEVRNGILILQTSTFAPSASTTTRFFIGTTDYGRIVTGVSNHYAGTVQFVLTNGFVPVLGNSFTLVESSAAASGGAFSTILGSITFGTNQFNLSYADGDAIATVGMAIAGLPPGPNPGLNSDGGRVLRLPASVGNYELESAPTVLGPWTPVVAPTVVENGERIVHLPATGTRFYRLVPIAPRPEGPQPQ